VTAVLVTFHASNDEVRQLALALLDQVDTLVIVDNTPSSGQSKLPRAPLQHERLQWLAQGRNLGLAKAQNIGIARARTIGSRFVLLVDQDSRPDPNMVRALAEMYDALSARGERVAAVGPLWFDRHTGEAVPFVQLGVLSMRSVRASEVSPEPVRSDVLVASGMLIPIAVIEAIGPMDESLFIDLIDTEWGLRAQRRGYWLYGVPAARLHHGIGTRAHRVWVGRWRTLPVHAPVRNYYQVRNILTVFFCRSAPWRWRLVYGLRLLVIVAAGALLNAPRGFRIQLMLRGVWDALVGRLGEYDPEQSPGATPTQP